MSYQQPPSSYSTTETNGWAVASLILAIAGWLGLFGLGGAAAVICGYIARNQIRESMGRQSGDGMATAGLVMGWLNIAMTLCGICISILVVTGVLAPALCLPFTGIFDGATW